MQVKLVSITPDAERLILYCARVSSNDQNSEKTGLLKYCIKHGHWSIFEMADATFEIETSRGISPQLLRHKSFSFQEFSQRYADVTEFETYRARRQAEKNRQSSIDDLPEDTIQWFYDTQFLINDYCHSKYSEALSRGIGREQARFLLPLSTQTRLYMKGSIRSWIHYLALRTKPDTQQEHREIALQIGDTLMHQLPIIGKACGWDKFFLDSLLTNAR